MKIILRWIIMTIENKLIFLLDMRKMITKTWIIILIKVQPIIPIMRLL